MSDDKAQIAAGRQKINQNRESAKSVAQELEKVRQWNQIVSQKVGVLAQKQRALISYLDGEIAKIQKEPPSSQRDRRVYLNQLRRAGVQVNVEMLETFIQQADPDRMLNPALIRSLEALKVRSDYIVLEFQIANYAQTISAVKTALDPEAAEGTGPLRQGSGPLGRTGGTGKLQPPGAPGAPGVQRPTTGRLGQGLPARTGGTGKLPPAPGVNRPGTAPLGAPARAGGPGLNRPGTAPLGAGVNRARPQTAELSQERKVLDGLKKSIDQPGVRENLRELVTRYEDLDGALFALRGPEAGELAVSAPEADAILKQARGKEYYLARVLSQLGPLSDLLAFESQVGDPAVARLLDSIQPAPAAAKPAAAGADQGGLADKLRNLFKL